MHGWYGIDIHPTLISKAPLKNVPQNQLDNPTLEKHQLR